MKLVDSYKLTDITNIQDVDLLSHFEDTGYSKAKFYVCYDGTIEHYFITGMRNGSFELHHRNYDEDIDATISDEFVDFAFSTLIRPHLDNGVTTRIIALDSHIKQYHRLATDIGKGIHMTFLLIINKMMERMYSVLERPKGNPLFGFPPINKM